MGRLGADAFAEEVDEGNVSLREALSWHLTANHYPPLPTAMIDTAVKAIELANEGEWDELVPLPEGIEYREQSFAPVTELVESMHLDSFIEYQEDL